MLPELVDDLQKEIIITRQAFADAVVSYESTVVELLYLIALALVYIAKK